MMENERTRQIKEEASRAADVLRNGGIILYPTDTVWGIGCSACNPEAVSKVFAIKQRIDSKALITLVDSLAMLERYVEDVPEIAFDLIEAAVNPLTIVYDKGVGIAENLTASDGSIGIRVTDDPLCRAIISRLKCPLVSTSANISGVNTPSCFYEIDVNIKNGVDYIVDYRQNENAQNAKPSSVIKIGKDGVIKILRK